MAGAAVNWFRPLLPDQFGGPVGDGRYSHGEAVQPPSSNRDEVGVMESKGKLWTVVEVFDDASSNRFCGSG